MTEIKRIVDRYEKIRGERNLLADKFQNGQRPYMIFQTPIGDILKDNRTPEQCFQSNLECINQSLKIPSDHFPVLEPWFGTGVYANMYGCEYVFREGEAPAVHYKYHTLDEIKKIEKPNWENSEIACLVMDTIRYFKNKTGDALPIVWTDTQSGSDTATLVLDASQCFIGCMIEKETTWNFMKGINDLIIEFSKAQEDLIGDALVKPGHIMLSNNRFSGFSISDDNLAVASPAVNEAFNLPLNEAIGEAMGGIAIHSCGDWTHTMPLLSQSVRSCTCIDCAVTFDVDPNPCNPELVRDALKGTGIYLHARMTGETEEMKKMVKKLVDPDLKLIIHPLFSDINTAHKNYSMLEEMLSDYYG
jgi:hypothetical protein